VPNGNYFVSVGFQRTNRKIGKIVTLYQRELFKKIPRLGTYRIQSVNEGLSRAAAPDDNIIHTMMFQNVSNYLTVNTVQHPTRLNLTEFANVKENGV